MAFEHLTSTIDARRSTHLFRQRFMMPVGHGRIIDFAGKNYLNFSSNDYLGMASHPKVIKAGQSALCEYGSSSGGSPLVTGYSRIQSQLEELLCDWLGYQRCLLFNSGFAANSGVIQTLLNDDCQLLIQDKLNHASLIDAGINCAAKSIRYRHNDMASLGQQLQRSSKDKLVVTEGVFSMDGDQAPLTQISELVNAHDSWLMIDDAHGIGVLGEQGKGSANEFGLTSGDVNIHMATFGKAVGTMGAVVAGAQDTIEYLIQHCRHYIYSTAMPPAMAAATLMSIQCLASENWRREKLKCLIAHFKQKMTEIGLNDNGSHTAIQPIMVGSAEAALTMSEQLKKVGIWLTAIRPPTVAVNESRLRVTLTAHHNESDIDQLFDYLGELV